MGTELHPTKLALLDAVERLLTEHDPDSIQVAEVLALADISTGSLYHHFADFGQLIETAVLRRFSRFVDSNVAAMKQILVQATTTQECIAFLRAVTRASNSVDRAPDRMARAQAMDLASRRPRFFELLAAEQQRLTDAITDLVRGAQERGWFRAELDPVSVSVMVQAYSFGRIVDDIAQDHVNPDAWCELVDELIERLFIA